MYLNELHIKWFFIQLASLSFFTIFVTMGQWRTIKENKRANSLSKREIVVVKSHGWTGDRTCDFWIDT